MNSNYKSINNIIPDIPYSELNFNTTIEADELNILRKRLQENIGFINYNKQRIRSQEYTQLMNFHQMALSTLNNMIMIKQVEKTNPYQSRSDKVSYYDSKGHIQNVNYNSIKKNEGWETQFDQNLINPPCYMLPPTGCFKPNK